MIAAPIVAFLLGLIAVTILLSALHVQSTREAAVAARSQAAERARIDRALAEASMEITKIATEAIAAIHVTEFESRER